MATHYDQIQGANGNIPACVPALTREGIDAVLTSATTLFTNPVDAPGAIYRADAFWKTNTADGQATATVTINIISTEGATAHTREMVMWPLTGVTEVVAIPIDATGVYQGSAVIRCDQNTAVQYSITEANAPDDDGDHDLILRFTRLS